MPKVTDRLANNKKELEHGGNYKETCASQDYLEAVVKN